MNITILICTFNGKNKLGDTLSYLTRLAKPDGVKDIEVLLVDNGSNDGTAAFAQEFWVTLNSEIPFRIITENKAGKAHALTTGYNAAKGDLIVLCDDDNWLDRNYLLYTEEIFNLNPEIGMAGGYGKSAVFANNDKPIWFDEFQHYFAVGTHHPHSRFLVKNDYSIFGAGSIIRKNVWNKIVSNGFVFKNSTNKGKAIAEDIELSMAVVIAGYSLYFDKRLTFIHDLRWGRLNFDNLCKQESANGKGNVYLKVYEILFHRVGTSFIFLRFIKEYLREILNVYKGLKTIKKQKENMYEHHYKLKLCNQKSLFYNLIILLPNLFVKFNSINNWIRKLALNRSVNVSAN